MVYLRHLAALLANGTFVISMFSVMPRTPTINYVPPLPMTVTTAQHVMIHLHPQLPHRPLKRSLSRFHPVLLHQYCHDFRRFSTFFFLSSKRPLI